MRSATAPGRSRVWFRGKSNMRMSHVVSALAVGSVAFLVTLGAANSPVADAAASPDDEDFVAAADAAAAAFSFGRQTDTDGGGITPLVLATRENCLECV